MIEPVSEVHTALTRQSKHFSLRAWTFAHVEKNVCVRRRLAGQPGVALRTGSDLR